MSCGAPDSVLTRVRCCIRPKRNVFGSATENRRSVLTELYLLDANATCLDNSLQDMARSALVLLIASCSL